MCHEKNNCVYGSLYIERMIDIYHRIIYERTTAIVPLF